MEIMLIICKKKDGKEKFRFVHMNSVTVLRNFIQFISEQESSCGVYITIIVICVNV